MQKYGMVIKNKRSPPSRGAWIEIRMLPNSPGLSTSPPSRGAWIEISGYQYDDLSVKSPPSRGAWIEMVLSISNGMLFSFLVHRIVSFPVIHPVEQKSTPLYRFILRDGLVLHGALLKHQEHRRRSASSSLRMIFWRIASSGSSGREFSISAASYLEAASQVTAGFLFTAVPQIA